jgi:hypothetical protein
MKKFHKNITPTSTKRLFWGGGGLRIYCPYNYKVTCAESEFKRHLCYTKKINHNPYYHIFCKFINCFSSDVSVALNTKPQNRNYFWYCSKQKSRRVFALFTDTFFCCKFISSAAFHSTLYILWLCRFKEICFVNILHLHSITFFSVNSANSLIEDINFELFSNKQN